ncbi:MAG: Abi family protein [Rhizobium sp.]|nr:Abi family protein [Rhizobium sp.]
MKFTKPSLDFAEQISLLKQRGMAIPDEDEALHYLKYISYYRLRAYWLPFEVPPSASGQHAFKAGTSFDDVLELYVFDRQLRILLIDAIERVEVAIRAAWAYHLAQTYGPHGYLDPNHYARADHFQKSLTSLLDEISRSRDTFIAHYRTKYSDPAQPPIWMTAEILSLGQLSKWVSNLKLRSDRKAIAANFGLDERVFLSVVHHLTYVRNICAHHGRLWNKQFIVTMMVPNTPASLRLAMNPHDTRRVYNTLAVMIYLLGKLAPGSTWRNEVRNLFSSAPKADPAAMGFPVDWTKMPYWEV